MASQVSPYVLSLEYTNILQLKSNTAPVYTLAEGKEYRDFFFGCQLRQRVQANHSRTPALHIVSLSLAVEGVSSFSKILSSSKHLLILHVNVFQKG
jgi:hypothetical protein